jgi:hypothetical protein
MKKIEEHCCRLGLDIKDLPLRCWVLFSTNIQLITSSGGQGRVFDDNADDDDYDEDDENSPVVLRQRQEQAYRSVAALQLRVEELTLEVTKVKSVNVIIVLYRVCVSVSRI